MSYRLPCLVLWACVVLVASQLVAQEAKPRPKPERFADRIQAFLDRDEEHPPEEGGIVFAGSSSMVRWNTDASFPNRGIINRGFGGSMIQDSIHYADKIILPYKPRTVVLYAGDNDLNFGLSAEAVAEDFTKFVKTVHDALPETRIIFVSVKPSTSRWRNVDTIRAFNAKIEALCQQDERLDYLDVFTPMLNDAGRPDETYLVQDGLHLSPAGYVLWTRLVGEKLDNP